MTLHESPGQATRPYPGLRPFSRSEADIFFGREEQTDQILDKLSRARFLGVVGGSGCGKSSLALAGLIPALETGLIVGAGFHWRIATFKPRNRPLRNLAEALLAPGVLGERREVPWDGAGSAGKEDRERAAPFVLATLRRGPLGLSDVLFSPLFPGDGPALPAGENLLLIVDQFEEIFRFRREGDADEADAFVALLLASAAQTRTNVYVVLTMRSDYLGDCAIFSGLPEALNDSQFLTPRLTREQRRAAIEGPAKVFGGEVEPALVGSLLNEMGPEPDRLPLMQHALARLWNIALRRVASEQGSDARVVLTLADYKSIGGLGAAIDMHAEEAYAFLDEAPEEGQRPKGARTGIRPVATPKQKIAEALFRCLSERDYSGRDTLLRDIRRPARLRNVRDVAGVSLKQVIEVVEVFRDPEVCFLTPVAGEPLDDDSVLDVTHESLIRRWKRLQDWVDDEAKAAETYRRLEESARLHRDGQASFLIPPELGRVVKWRDEKQPSLAWATRYGKDFALAMEFLDLSQRAREAARFNEDLLRAAPKIVVVAAVLLAALVGGFFRERHLRTVAETESEKAKLATTAATLAVARGEYQRERAVEAERVSQKNLEASLKSTKRADSEAFKARMLLLSNESQILSPTNPQQGVLLAAQAVEESTRAMKGSGHDQGEDRTLARLDLDSETALRRTLVNISGRGLKGHRGPVRALSLETKDGSLGLTGNGWFATGGIDARLLLWPLQSGSVAATSLELPRLAGGEGGPWALVDFVRVTGDGRWLVAGCSASGTIRLWDIRSEGARRWLDLGPEPGVYYHFMSSSGRWLVTQYRSAAPGEFNRTLWDLARDYPGPIELTLKESEVLPYYSISDDDRWLAFCGTDGAAHLWDLERASEKDFGPVKLARLPGAAEFQPTQAVNCEFSRGGRRLVVCLDNATAYLYDPAVADRKPTIQPLHPSGKPRFRSVLTDLRGLWAVSAAIPDGSPSPGVTAPGDVNAAAAQPVFLNPAVGQAPGAGSSEQVYLWDLTSAPEVPPPTLLEGFVTPRDRANFRVSENGRRAFVSADDGRFLLWNLAKERPAAGGSEPAPGRGVVPIRLFAGDLPYRGTATVPVSQFTLSRDGRWVAGSVYAVGYSVDNRPCVWDLDAVVSTTQGVPGLMLRGHEGAITALAFSADSRHLVTASEDSTSRIWELLELSPSAQPQKLLSVTEGTVTGHRGLISKNGRWLAIIRGDGVAELSDLWGTGRPVRLQSIFPSGTRTRFVISSVDGRWLGLIAPGHDVVLLDLTAEDPAARPIILSGLYDAPYSLVTDSSGHSFAATSLELDGNTKIPTDAKSSTRVRLWRLETDGRTAVPLARDKEPRGWALGFDQRARLLIFREEGTEGELVLFDVTAAGKAASAAAVSAAAENRIVTGVEWYLASPDGSRLLTWRLDRKKEGRFFEVSAWDLREDDPKTSQSVLMTAPDINGLFSSPVHSAFSQDTRWWLDIAAGKADLISLDAALESKPVSLLAQGKSASLPPTPDRAGRWLVTSSTDKGTQLWDLLAARPEAEPIPLQTETSPVTAVFSPDGRWLATAAGDSARLWDLSRTEAGGPAPRSILVRGLDGGSIAALTVTSNARWLGILWSDGVVRLSELEPKGSVAADIATLPGHSTTGSPSVVVSPDGKQVITVSDDSVAISTVPQQKLMEISQQAVGRNLTREEWKKYIPSVGSWSRTFRSLPDPDAENVVPGDWKEVDLPGDLFAPKR